MHGENKKSPVTVDRKEIFGWSMFDFANSSFTTVILTAFFSVYFKDVIVGNSDTGKMLWGIAIGISQAIVVLSAPLLGAVADFSGAKKKFLFVTYLLCSLATMALGLITPGHVIFAMSLFIVANVSYSSGENFVSAFLPEIAPPEMMGRISAIAWSLGYMGGLGALVASLGILSVTHGEGHRYIWLMVGLWFFLAGLPTFMFVRERHKREPMPVGQTIYTIGFYRLARTLRELARFRQLFLFLITYMIYGAGIFAVIGFASIIARELLHFTDTNMGVFMIVLNITAAIGALLGGWAQDRIGSKAAILISLSCWILALLFVLGISPPGKEGPTQSAVVLFWIAGNIVGLSMGATYSASRALVGLFSPEDRTAEFFGLWGLFGKLGAAIGSLTFGIVSAGAGLHVAILVLGAFFLTGFLLMLTVNVDQGRKAVAG